MNHSESRLRINPRIVPPDLLLKFGYSPSGGIKFDRAAQTLNFYQGGTQRVDVTSFGLAVRNGNGLVVGYTAQVATGGVTAEVQVVGTGSSDADVLLGKWSTTDTAGPTLSFLKSGNPAIGSNTIVTDGENLGIIYFRADDGTDFASQAASIQAQIDGSPGVNDVPGRLILATTKDGAENPTEALRIDSSQNVSMRSESHLWIGPDSAATGYTHGGLTVGLIINQEANDDAMIVGKSSDVAHGVTGLGGFASETDDAWLMGKASAALGGWGLLAISDAADIAVNMQVFVGGNLNIVKSKSALSAGMRIFVSQHNGSNALADVVANGNIFLVAGRNGGSFETAFMVDTEGDLFANAGTTTTAVTVFDNEDDIGLVRAFDVARSEAGVGGIVRDKWDEWATKNESDLVRLGVLGDTLANGGLTNVTRLQQLHNGAIWQLNTKHMSLVERVEVLSRELVDTKKQLAALTA